MVLIPLLVVLGIASPVLVRESLTGTHFRYIENGVEVHLTIRPDGKREETRTARRPVRREIEGSGLLRVIRERDLETGSIVREIPMYYNAKPARVFDPNPVTALNDPTLRDQNDASSAVPESAYRVVNLQGVADEGPLSGPHVRIVDVQAPAVPPVSGSGALLFDRAHNGFEDVNAYFHLDQSQRYLQTLGYVGLRAVAAYPIEVDTHALNGTDNSFFIASPTIEGKGTLVFGEGGTDDAEDADLLIHEYAHAIHEWIAPGTFLGARSSEARAIGEGFGDYWALSASYAEARSSGRDPFCIADWDARCAGDSPSELCAYPPGADCLRRVDGTKTIADVVRGEEAGAEHRNGEIWSSALRALFVALVERYGETSGRQIADRIVIEAFFGTPPNPSFASMAARMIAADRYLSGGVHQDLICAAMSERGILTGCSPLPRGELTWFQSPQRGLTVPDNDASGVTAPIVVTDARLIERLYVNVHVKHSGRGELRITLIAPDGTEIRLLNSSPDRVADVVATFGRDALPVESLEVLRGRSAAGEWRLRVVDVAFGDIGELVSWSLVVQFQGESALEARPSPVTVRQFIPVVGRTPGAQGTFFTSDVRILNPHTREERVSLIFTPSGTDGRTNFSAVDIVARPGEIVAFEDIVGTAFGTGGTGQLEIAGDVVVTSRTSTESSAGRFGLSAPPATEVARRGDAPLDVPQLQSNPEFRSNVGWAETTGGEGTVRIRTFDAESGMLIATSVHPVLPFSHGQIAVGGARRMLAEISVIDGTASVAGYGAVIDNRSGDPMLIPAMRDRGQAGLVSPAINGRGAGGTDWRTDVWFTKSGSATPIRGLFPINYYPEDGGRSSGPNIEPPPAHTSEIVRDVVATYHGPGSRGTLTATSDREILYTSRIWTPGVVGTFGQFVPWKVPSRDPVQHLVFIESGDEHRTNVGALAGPDGADFEIHVYSSAGNSLQSTRHRLQAYGFVQFQVPPGITNGRAEVRLFSGSIYAYAAVVDNRSGDPLFVPAQ